MYWVDYQSVMVSTNIKVEIKIRLEVKKSNNLEDLLYPRDLREAIVQVKLYHWDCMEVCKSLRQHQIDHNYNMPLRRELKP